MPRNNISNVLALITPEKYVRPLAVSNVIKGSTQAEHNKNIVTERLDPVIDVVEDVLN
ncbi:hypothetical protein [Vibrio navarrensis]|uniref:hypothetical protein n=1 Tax=Vibrio navarrensis TaxID=29495 RepID=UPI001D05BCD6|nr:hypothetical protein [Vibrio navarrensis]